MADEEGGCSLNVLIIGLGSIGKRHIRCLRSIVDAKIIALRGRSSRGEDDFVRQFDIVEVEDFQSAWRHDLDFAIIATPTSLHLDLALKIAEAGIPFFLEKPVSHSWEGIDRLQRIVDEKNIPVLVGFQMRHHPGYQNMMKWIAEGRIGKPLCCHGFVGQYLPDWRPGTDYRKSYSATVAMGGGVINDLSHQIDISLSVMGQAETVSGMCGRISDLEIESEDIANILIGHRKGSGFSHIHLNYLERTYEWYTRITGTEGSIIWDYGKGTAHCLRYDRKNVDYRIPGDFNRDTLFTDQMRHWLDVVAGKSEPVVPLSRGIETTAVALAAKASSKEERHITL
jgi:predicted dehydrogenase